MLPRCEVSVILPVMRIFKETRKSELRKGLGFFVCFVSWFETTRNKPDWNGEKRKKYKIREKLRGWIVIANFEHFGGKFLYWKASTNFGSNLNYVSCFCFWHNTAQRTKPRKLWVKFVVEKTCSDIIITEIFPFFVGCSLLAVWDIFLLYGKEKLGNIHTNILLWMWNAKFRSKQKSYNKIK